MRVTRRSLLAALVGSGGVSIAVALGIRVFNEEASASSSSPTPTPVVALSAPSGPPVVSAPASPSIRGGKVAEVTDDHLELEDSLVGRTTLFLSPNTVYDEGFWTGELPLLAGDYITAKVSIRPDGSYEATDVWTNFENLIGPVLGVDGGPTAPFSLTMSDRYDAPHNRVEYLEAGHRVLIDPRTMLRQLTSNPPANIALGPVGDQPLDIAPGHVIEAIGRDTPDGVLAVTLFLDL